MIHRRRDIDRYLAEGLAAEAERELRSHLRDCAACRQFYDEEVRLRRALAGNAGQPTRAEIERVQRLVLERAGLRSPIAAPTRDRPLAERLGSLRWRVALPLSAVAVVALLWLLYPWNRTPPLQPASNGPAQRVLAARLTQATGLTIDGSAAKPGAVIVAGAALVVPAQGLAELELVRGGRVRLFPRTRLTLTPRGEAIRLEEGKVWCDVEPARGRFSVSTERGEVRVVGTSFVVEDLPGGDTEVRVLSGSVEVEDAGHRSVVKLRGSQRSRLQAGAPPTPALRYDPQADRIDWDEALRQIGRDVERAFRRLGNKLRIP